MLIVAMALLASSPADAAPTAQAAAAPVATAHVPATAPAAKPAADWDKVICHVDLKTGSRLNYTRTCKTARQWDQDIHEQATYLEKQESQISY